jgi:hypothetical protein
MSLRKVKKLPKLSEYIANMIRNELQDEGINCVDQRQLDSFEVWIRDLIQETFAGEKVQDKNVN